MRSAASSSHLPALEEMRKMLCVIAKLDHQATGRLNEIQRSAFPAGTERKTIYGHITLATYIGEDEASFIQSCRKSMADVSAFDIVYDRIEVLEETSIIVAAPAKSEPLSSLHRCIAEQYNDALDRWTKEGCWYPHTTLVFDPRADLNRICNKMADSFSPFRACVYKIEFSRVCANAYEIIDSMDLCSQ